ncbi:MAG TPA: dihydropteroate synthase, partial [Solirubrobacterales bacterium]
MRARARCRGPAQGLRAATLPSSTAAFPVAISDVKLMGVVNVTPDSFSDGGLYLDPEAAIEHGRELTADGAAILDVGGESTRPGAAPVPVEEELRRVEPVVAGLAGVGAAISVDTSKAAVAAAALDAGAAIVNDVTALRGDPEMAALVAERGAGLILMHMAGKPRTMQQNPEYDDVVVEVREFLAVRL